MLVIVSDLHLSDGSLGPTLPAAAIDLFARKLNELALAASVRAGGRFRPIEAIDLVLLGDVLDLIRSAEWLSTDARPWHDPQSPPVFDAVNRIAAGVLEHNEPTLQILRQMTHQAAPVRIHYMVGNHDWPLHLPGEPYGRLRAQVVERMGLANRSDIPFPHDPAEGGPLMEVLRRHRVLARHGDIYDPIHFETDRNSSSLGDALSIELFGRFQQEFCRFDGELSEATLAGLADLGDVRPMLLAPAWIDDVLNRTYCSAATQSKVRSLWDRLVNQLLESAALRSREAWKPVDLVDALAQSLQFGRRTRSGNALADCFNGANDPGETYRRHALAEEEFRNRSVNHVVYGHTHQTEFAPLETNFSERRPPDQFYFNAGTWRHVVSPTQRSSAETMTLLAFYEQDERSGRPFETWTGSWSQSSSGPAIRRFDSCHAPSFQSCRRICNTTLSESVPGSG
jgi:UDP-2,3-diacylglucosamine pyrophosphatase LpxH